MRRRGLLAAGAAVGLAGCLRSASRAGTDPATPAARRTDAPPVYRRDQPVDPTPAYRGRFVGGGAVVDNVETTAHWSGDVAADGSRYFGGSQSLRFEGRGRAVATDDYADRPLDLTDRDLSLAYYPDRPDAQPTLFVDLFAPDLDNRLQLARPYVGNWSLGWQRLDVGPHAVVGDPDLSSVTKLRLAVTHDRIRGWVDDFRAHPKPDRGAVVFRFDDTDAHHYTDYRPVLERYGYPGVEAVVPQYVGTDGHLDREALTTLDAAGWDLADHTYDHRNVRDLPPAQLRATLERSDRWFADHGFEAGAFVYPYGAYDAAALSVLGDRFDLAFCGGGVANVAVTNPLTVASWNADAPLRATRRRIDRAATHRSLLVLMVHTLAAGKFEQVVEHVHSKRSALDVLTARGLLDRARALHGRAGELHGG